MLIRRLSVLIVLPIALFTAGCGQVEQAANDAADDALSGASQAVEDAASDVAQATTGEVVKQICKPLQDGQVSAEDQQFLSGLVSSAETAGVSAEFTGPLREIAEAGDQVPAESVDALREKCDANTGS